MAFDHELITTLRTNAPSRDLDVRVCNAVMPSSGFAFEKVFGSDRKLPIKWGKTGNLVEDGIFNIKEAPPVTSSMDAAVRMCENVLPGWGWRIATCCVSDDAWVFPDFNSPAHGERLREEFRQDIDWAETTDIDLRPAGRPAMALILAVMSALSFVRSTNQEEVVG